jgi:putative heme-binding domain-containing protein
VKLTQTAATIEEQIAGLMYSRMIKIGWTPELRRDYFSWFNNDHTTAHHPDQLVKWFDEAGRPYANGNSFNGFLQRIRTEAMATLTPEEQESLSGILTGYRPPPGRGARGAGARGGPATAPATAPLSSATDVGLASAVEQAAPAPRAFVRDWTVADLESSLSDVSRGRNFERGKAAYAAAQCAACHAMAGTPAQGGVGPDLTAIAARFHRQDILESIIEPSKVISEQFADTMVRLKNGDVVVGRVLEDADQRMVFQTNPRATDKTEVKKSDIEMRKFSPISPMPTGLVNYLSKDEILDLLAYLEAAGRPEHPDFSN